MIDLIKVQISEKLKGQDYTIAKTFKKIVEEQEEKVGKLKQIFDGFNEAFAQTVLEFLTPEMVESLNEPFN